jgi:uncharacterized membrane protein
MRTDQSTEDEAAPYFPPPSQAPAKRIAHLQVKDIAYCLRAACRDLRFAPLISLFYGACFWIMALAIALVFQEKPQYTMSFASGCLLIGPFLALGLYDLSRRHEQNLPADFWASAMCWADHLRSLSILLLVMLVLELLWGRISLVVFAIFFDTGFNPDSNTLNTVLAPENWNFLAVYTGIGLIFALLVYITSVVSMPTILDRDTDAIFAVITSFEVFFNNTFVLLVWGFVIALLVAISLVLPYSVGILLFGPLLGHASWHMYRKSVTWTAAPAAPP